MPTEKPGTAVRFAARVARREVSRRDLPRLEFFSSQESFVFGYFGVSLPRKSQRGN